MLSIGFTGTRHGMNILQIAAVTDIVRDASDWHDHIDAHHGDCRGADAGFHAIVQVLRGHASWSIIVHPATRSEYRAFCQGGNILKPKPFMARNQDIVDTSTVMIAAPAEATEQQRGGTWATIRMARKAGKPLAIVLPSGEVVKDRWP